MGTQTCVAGLSQQTCYAEDNHASSKKDAPSSELSNIVFFHSSNVNWIETGNAGFIPHVARCFFSMIHDKILLYIYIYI